MLAVYHILCLLSFVSFSSCLDKLEEFFELVSQSSEVPWVLSPSNLFRLAVLEETIYNITIQNSQDPKLKEAFLDIEYKEIARWIQEYESETQLFSVNSTSHSHLNEISSNPLLSLNMVSRMAWINNILHNFTDPYNQQLKKTEFFNIAKDFYRNYGLPNIEHVRSMYRAILVVQYTYEFSAKDLFQGAFGKYKAGTSLTPKQAIDIGLLARQMKLYPEALEWFQTVISTLKNDPRTELLAQSNILLLDTVKEHDAMFDKIENSDLNQLDELFTNRYKNKILSNEKLITQKQYTMQNRQFGRDAAYIKLCNGQNTLDDLAKSTLYCTLDSYSNHPHFILSPLKIEIHSLSPYIVQIYDAITDRMNEFFADSGDKQTKESQVVYHDQKNDKMKCISSSSRISTTSYIDQLDHLTEQQEYFTDYIEKRIEDITNLRVSNKNDPYLFASENFQITSYTTGGYFKGHSDNLIHKLDYEERIGDRMATFMIYLNDVYGGYTVFPEAGAAVVPVKNSALFWFNSYRNRTIDNRVFHGGCPVIFGSKWIVTKWIRSNSNMFRRKCSINQFE